MSLSTADCYRLWDKYQLPPYKRTHSSVIAAVADVLSTKLIAVGEEINQELLRAACLLHDIDKAVEKLPDEHHPDSSVRVLRSEGLDAVAEVVRTHSLHCILDDATKPKSWEQRLLFLADKMVKHELIGVDARFALWRAEQLPDEAREILDAAYPLVKQLERDILRRAGMAPTQLRHILAQRFHSG